MSHGLSDSVRYEVDTPLDAVRRGYGGRGRWSGCDWITAFGPRRLNLQGLYARQARLLANALAGEEAAAWREAETWLETIERDARSAELAAAEALRLATADDFAGAVQSAGHALEIETRYRHDPVWKVLETVCRMAAEQCLAR